MKNLIATACNARFGDFLVHDWLTSLQDNVHLQNCDVLVLDYGLTPQQVSALTSRGVLVHPCREGGKIVNIRFFDLAHYLKKNFYDQVMFTDGGDIIFQQDVSVLFAQEKSMIRAVCEDSYSAFIEMFCSKRDFSEDVVFSIKTLLSGKKLINCGVLVAPSSVFIDFAREFKSALKSSDHFGPDQVFFNYYAYRRGFVPLDATYNFVLKTAARRFTIRRGIFYDGFGKPIAVVHNAGNVEIFRPIHNFGYGVGKNKMKLFNYPIIKGFTKMLSFFFGTKQPAFSKKG